MTLGYGMIILGCCRRVGMADEADSKSVVGNHVRVQVPLPAFWKDLQSNSAGLFFANKMNVREGYMKEYLGKSVLEGIAEGKLFLYHKKEYIVERSSERESSEEWERFQAACSEAREQLIKLYQETVSEAGKEQAEIFAGYQMFLEDQEYLGTIRKMIDKSHVSAEYAVQQVGEAFKQMFLAMEDEYMQARGADMEDISGRLLRILTGSDPAGVQGELGDLNTDIKEPVILLARELSPSETLGLDKEKILGIVTTEGSVHSHAAILARSMGIPALVGVDMVLSGSLHGKNGIVDGFQGRLVVEPDESTVKAMRRKRELWLMEEEALKELKEEENRTLSGRRIDIYANIGSVEEVLEAKKAGAGGIGLLRSEFLYLGRKDYPGEEEQFQSYLAVIRQMQNKKVVIRTMDMGADKRAGYFGLEPEENPALGYRAIRVCLDRPDMFMTQLRAIYRASAYGQVGVMFPMIVSLDEVQQIRKLTKQVVQELTQEGYSVGKPELGIMIETPAAALIARELAKEVDFFSIGTNDLTQYTLAADRESSRLSSFYTVPHAAVLRLIRMTVEAGHEAGIRVGICGELAADLSMTEDFLAMGVDVLSAVPSAILKLRRKVRSLS